MLAQTPLSADPDLHSGIVTRLDDIVEIAREELGDWLQTILLGGSLARGEAFGVLEGNDLRLLSDLDLYFVTGGDGSGLARRIRAYAEADSFLVTRPDVAVVPASYFAEANASMPMHQLAHAHCLLWGDPVEIVAARDRRGGPQVDPGDAAELLLNRFVESLDPALGDGLPFLMHRTKQFIDAPMAWLGSVGEYTPDRFAQIERLRELGARWSSTTIEHLDSALNHWAACLKARRKGVVDRAELEALAGVAGSEDDWQNWTGGFAMALLTGGGIGHLHDAMRDGLDRDALRVAVDGWLRREPLLARMRRARRWAGIAPESVTGWLHHGAGGSGPDRIFAAACLRYHGVDPWTAPLDELVHEPVESAAGLHALWWRWIQGRGDDA